MTTTSRLYFLFAFVFFSINFLSAQNRDNYDLLWEIQHKNSDKKSYLFGTLHVKDNRAFQFSDSVIPMIKKAQMFALEIHPDSVYDKFNENYYSTGLENVFKKNLSKEDYLRLKDRFYEVNKSDLDSFPLLHPQLIESMLTLERGKPNDRRTFLDAYLYGFAYNNKKEIAGLEKVEDQIPTIDNINEDDVKASILYLLNTSVEEQYNDLEEITQLYYNGDIEKILHYINKYGPDEIMVRRNKVMANSIEEIMQNKTVFAAVGTAHLPGKDGVIQLLREKGFTVKKVNATFTQDDEQYSILPDTDRWYTDNNQSLGYNVLTPNKPIAVTIGDKFEILTSTDLIYGGAFAYMAMDLRNETIVKDYDFIENVLKGQMKEKTDSLISRKTFIKDSIEFTEVLIKKEKNISRMQIAFTNKIVYFFFTENSMDDVTSPYADAFFTSIKVFTPKFEPSVWHTKTDPVGAYSISFPDQEKDLSRERENPGGNEESPYILNIFTSVDKANHTLYLFRYNDQPVGYYLNDREGYYTFFENYFKERGMIIHEAKELIMDNAEGKTYELMISEKYHSIAKLILRGNRTYLLIAQKTVENEKIAADDAFFNSFKFLPYADVTFNNPVAIGEKYSFKTPNEKLSIDEDTYDSNSEYSSIKNYSALDTTTSGTYLVQEIKVKPYFREKSLEAFYDKYIEVLTDYNDTVISNVPTTLGGKPAREIRIENTNTHVKQRMKLLLDDDTILLFLTYLGDEEINEPRVDDFFNSLQINKNMQNFNLTASKTDLIFKNLKSKDSIKFEEAKGALQYYQFDNSDYKLLEKSLKKHYSDDTIYYGAKYYIIDNLVNLETPETLKTLTDLYNNKKTDNNIKLTVLQRILDLKNIESETTYLDLLENQPPKRISGKPFNVLSSLADTISVFVKNDMLFAKLAETNDYRDKIITLYNNYVLSDSIYIDKMPLLKNVLFKNMYSDAEKYLDTISRNNYSYLNYSLIYNYIDIAKKSDKNNPEIIKTLKLLVEKLENDPWLKTQSLMASLNLDIEVDSEILNAAFEDMYSRFEMMESMVDAEKTNLIPKEYLEPVEFAKLSLYHTSVEEYDDYAIASTLLGEISFDGKNYYVFTFSYNEEDEEEKYLGVVEQSAIDFSNFKMATTYIDWELAEEDWTTQAEKVIKNAKDSEDSELE